MWEEKWYLRVLFEERVFVVSQVMSVRRILSSILGCFVEGEVGP